MKVRAGEWFAVPLRDGNFALGLAARVNRSPQVLGYFFGPATNQPPLARAANHLRPTDAALVGIFSDLKIRRSEWPVIGMSDNWHRDEWPMPVFTRFQEIDSKHYLQYYDDSNPDVSLRSVAVSADEASGKPEDGLMGAGFVEIRLTRLLAQM